MKKNNKYLENDFNQYDNKSKQRNFVAKNSSKFNRSEVFRDKVNDYKRKSKYRIQIEEN
jgi:hypothetical protein